MKVWPPENIFGLHFKVAASVTIQKHLSTWCKQTPYKSSASSLGRNDLKASTVGVN